MLCSCREPAAPSPANCLDLVIGDVGCKSWGHTGTQLSVVGGAVVFESVSSYNQVRILEQADHVEADGHPVDIDGFWMVPIKPDGAIEGRCVTNLFHEVAKAANGVGPKFQDTELGFPKVFFLD